MNISRSPRLPRYVGDILLLGNNYDNCDYLCVKDEYSMGSTVIVRDEGQPTVPPLARLSLAVRQRNLFTVVTVRRISGANF